VSDELNTTASAATGLTEEQVKAMIAESDRQRNEAERKAQVRQGVLKSKLNGDESFLQFLPDSADQSVVEKAADILASALNKSVASANQGRTIGNPDPALGTPIPRRSNDSIPASELIRRGLTPRPEPSRGVNFPDTARAPK